MPVPSRLRSRTPNLLVLSPPARESFPVTSSDQVSRVMTSMSTTPSLYAAGRISTSWMMRSERSNRSVSFTLRTETFSPLLKSRMRRITSGRVTMWAWLTRR